MAAFLLVHGACHGAWCWDDVIPRLAAAGHIARAIDMPGRGPDKRDPATVTLGDHVAAILAAIDGPVVLVGHSLGGMWISAAAEAAPDRIARLVYVAAWAPKDGESARGLRETGASPLLASALRRSDGTFTYADDDIEALFYHDCPPETLNRARPRLVPEPSLPAQTPVTLGARYASVPRRYIRCTDDRAILPRAQAAMSADWSDTHDLACAHSPFFACPDRLAQLLLKTAETP